MATWIKICGITSLEDARLAVEAGADALGLNFVPASKRVIDAATAAHIADALGRAVELVAVVANRGVLALEELREATGLEWLQLHGTEAAEELELLLPYAFKAIAIETASDVSHADDYAGQRILTDAKVAGEFGGTGQSFDWSLVAELGRRRDLILAGGLTPGNVGRAIAAVRPWGVDVASGVEREGNPRAKDPTKLRDFVRAVRAADAER
jgi:phosphoribosylanthranilate isomerase